MGNRAANTHAVGASLETRSGQGRRHLLNARWQRYLAGYWMVLPALLLYVVFIVYPMATGVRTSFYRWDGFSDKEWVGLANYRFVFHDEVFWKALRNTFVFAIVVTIAKNVLGLFLAVILNQELRGRTFFRTISFVPVTMSFVVVGVLWSWIYNPTFGLLNSALESLGLGFVIRGWLSDPVVALWSVMAVDVWKWVGFHTILFLAGLQGIPQDLIEASMLDGANRWQRFYQIVLPLLKQVTAVSVMLSLLGAFVNNYDLVFVMTGGGPDHATEVSLTWIVATAFRYTALGKASAMSVILFACVLAFGLVQFKLMTRGSHEE
ncbi:MAG: sugar ABC transporter permease [Thermomicrobiales bacterium]